eukprot:COSAG02_NODE_2290_length_9205_cov_21.549198_2_plen_106_part_00
MGGDPDCLAAGFSPEEDCGAVRDTESSPDCVVVTPLDDLALDILGGQDPISWMMGVEDIPSYVGFNPCTPPNFDDSPYDGFPGSCLNYIAWLGIPDQLQGTRRRP